MKSGAVKKCRPKSPSPGASHILNTFCSPETLHYNWGELFNDNRNHNFYYLFNTLYITPTWDQTHWIFIITLQDRYYYCSCCFTENETKTQKDKGIELEGSGAGIGSQVCWPESPQQASYGLCTPQCRLDNISSKSIGQIWTQNLPMIPKYSPPI